jgi:hypothetical protein
MLGYQNSSQSLTGSIYYDDGAGSSISDGNIECNNITVKNIATIQGALTLQDIIITNSSIVENEQLGYVAGCTSNIQDQFNSIDNSLNIIDSDLLTVHSQLFDLDSKDIIIDASLDYLNSVSVNFQNKFNEIDNSLNAIDISLNYFDYQNEILFSELQYTNTTNGEQDVSINLLFSHQIIQDASINSVEPYNVDISLNSLYEKDLIFDASFVDVQNQINNIDLNIAVLQSDQNVLYYGELTYYDASSTAISVFRDPSYSIIAPFLYTGENNAGMSCNVSAGTITIYNTGLYNIQYNITGYLTTIGGSGNDIAVAIFINGIEQKNSESAMSFQVFGQLYSLTSSDMNLLIAGDVISIRMTQTNSSTTRIFRMTNANLGVYLIGNGIYSDASYTYLTGYNTQQDSSLNSLSAYNLVQDASLALITTKTNRQTYQSNGTFWTGYLCSGFNNGNTILNRSSFPSSNYFLVISGNYNIGNGDVNFMNTYFNNLSSGAYAFSFFKYQTTNTVAQIAGIKNNGDFVCNDITSPTITTLQSKTVSIVANGSSHLTLTGDISFNNASTISGYLWNIVSYGLTSPSSHYATGGYALSKSAGHCLFGIPTYINDNLYITGNMYVNFDTTATFTYGSLDTVFLVGASGIVLSSGKYLDLSSNNTSIKTSAGTITNANIGTLLNNTQNINDKFTSLDSSISTLQTNTQGLTYSGGVNYLVGDLDFNFSAYSSFHIGSDAIATFYSGGLSLWDDMNLSINGTGFISQNGTGTNTLNTIELNTGSYLDLSTNNTSILTTAGSITNSVLGYLYGASSNLQTQITNLASQVGGVFDLSNVFFTGQTHFSKNINLPTDYSGGYPTNSQLGYVENQGEASPITLNVYNVITPLRVIITQVEGVYAINWSFHIYGSGALQSLMIGISDNPYDFSTTVGKVVRNYDSGYISMGEYIYNGIYFHRALTKPNDFYVLHKCNAYSSSDMHYNFSYQLVKIA